MQPRGFYPVLFVDEIRSGAEPILPFLMKSVLLYYQTTYGQGRFAGAGRPCSSGRGAQRASLGRAISPTPPHISKRFFTASPEDTSTSNRKLDNPYSRLPLQSWEDPALCREFFESVRARAGLAQLGDFYNITLKQLHGLGGAGLLGWYNFSLKTALARAYPEHEWFEWKFTRVAPEYWDSVENQRTFLDWVAKQLHLESMDSWYSVTQEQLYELNGTTLLVKRHNGSMYSLLKTVYPDHEWLEWKFQLVPKGFWKHPENVRRYFEWLGTQLGVRKMDDWYDYEVEDWYQYCANGFMSRYFKNSKKVALSFAFPEHVWDAKRFKLSAYQNISIDEIRQTLETTLVPKLKIQSPEDWYRVSWQQVSDAGFSKLIQKYRGLGELLSDLYPEHQWDKKRFSQRGRGGTRAAQRMLHLAVQELFPNHEIVEEYQLSLAESSKKPLQFDVAIPALNLVFEYQGTLHYKDLYRYGQFSETGLTDLDKAASCQRANVTLITVPHWWDEKASSLSNTIRQQRPDLIPAAVGDGNPIPQSPP